MNTPLAPNTPADPADDRLVARLRAALDEVTATTPAANTVGAPRPGTSPFGWRWVAAAAAGIALVGGAVLVLRGANREPLQPTAAETTTDAVTTTVGGAWSAVLPYVLIAADLPPRGATDGNPCCLTADEVLLAWARNGDPGDAVVVARATPLSAEVSPVTTPTATVITVGGSALAVDSRGVDEAERADLLASIQPGSGVPFVLGTEGWELIAMSTAADAAPVVQQYGSSVRLTAGASADVFFSMVSAPTVRAVTVAGQPGWALEYTGGYALVVWRHPESGRWVTMDIGADLAGRVDGLIAAVAVNGSVTDPTLPPPESVPVPGLLHTTQITGVLGELTGNAVGQEVPVFRTESGDYRFDDGTESVLILAGSCITCIPSADITMYNHARVAVVIDPSVLEDSLTYLTLIEFGGDILVDIDPEVDSEAVGAMASYGLGHVLLTIGRDGLLTGVQPLEPNHEALGRVIIPAIDVDWVVVEGGSDHEAAMKRGPIMTADRVTGTPTILGHRTTYGAPFLRLDELQPGDTFTIVSLDGTRTFEVTLVETCQGDEVCAAQESDDLLLATYDPKYTDRARLTIHATEVAGS